MLTFNNFSSVGVIWNLFDSSNADQTRVMAFHDESFQGMSLFIMQRFWLTAVLFIYLASSYLATGVQAVIEGDAFHTQSPVARNVLCAAEKLDGWLQHPENRLPAKEFSSWLLSTLKACVPRDKLYKNEGEDVECISSAPLFVFICFQMAVLSEAELRCGKPSYLVSKYW